MTDDFIGCTLLPRLVTAVAEVAPFVELAVLPRGAPGRKALLRAGKGDVAIGHFSGAGADLHRRVLWLEPWVSLVGTGNGRRRRWDIESWTSLVHVVVSPTGIAAVRGRRGRVDAAVARGGDEP